MSKAPTLLPLGTAVTLEDEDGIYIIVARGFQKADDGFLAGYKGVRHPLGAGSGAREVVIREAQIAEILHRGYESPEDTEFAKKQLEVAKAPPVKQAAIPEPDLTIDLSKPVAPRPTTPAPSADDAHPTAAIADPTDPFGELRSKGRRK